VYPRLLKAELAVSTIFVSIVAVLCATTSTLAAPNGDETADSRSHATQAPKRDGQAASPPAVRKPTASQPSTTPVAPPPPPNTLPKALYQRGKWQLKNGQLAPTRTAVRWRGFWIGQTAPASNVAVRMHLKASWRRNITLLFRGQLDAKKKRIKSGYALRIHGRQAWIARVKNGVARRIYAKGRTKRKGLRWTHYRNALDIMLVAAGEHVIVHVQTASGRTLGFFHQSNIREQSGYVGLLAHGRYDRRFSLLGLTARPLCQSPPTPADQGPYLSFAAPESKRATLQALSHVIALEQVPQNGSAQNGSAQNGSTQNGSTQNGSTQSGRAPWLFRANLDGLEQAICAGTTPTQLSSMLPWKYHDLAYLELRKKPLQRDEHGRAQLNLSYKNPQMVTAILKDFARRYPKIARLKRIGRSRQGRPIWALRILAHDDKKSRRRTRATVLFNGAHHGNEPLSVEIVLDIISTLLDSAKSPQVARWLKNYEFWCVPLINPDGLLAFMEVARNTGRKNGAGARHKGPHRTGRGVDLNRNYPFQWGVSGNVGSKPKRSHQHYRGPNAASEPETRAMMALARRQRFASSISFHTGTIALLSPYTIDKIKNTKPDVAWSIAEKLIEGLPDHPQKRPFKVRRKLYSVEGVDQDWLMHSFGTLAYLVEASRWSPLEPDKRLEVLKANRPIWKRLLDRYLDGPTLSGHVSDRRGRPVKGAVVRIRQIQLRAGERWTVRPRDGRFDRFLPGPGLYHVDVVAPGFRPTTRRVRVKSGKRHIWIKLRKKR
jgi:hypothetical protein